MAKKKKSAKKRSAKKVVRRAAPKRKARKARPVAKPKAVAKAKPAAAPPSASEITPYLCCKGAAAALDFYAQAFGAVETLRIAGKDGSIGHAGITIEGAPLMVSDE